MIGRLWGKSTRAALLANAATVDTASGTPADRSAGSLGMHGEYSTMVAKDWYRSDLRENVWLGHWPRSTI
jgi:hypothetical protein